MVIPRVYKNLALAEANLAAYAEQMKDNAFIYCKKCFSHNGDMSYEYIFLTEKELMNSFIFPIIKKEKYTPVKKERACMYFLQLLDNLHIRKYIPKAEDQKFSSFDLYTAVGNIYNVSVKKTGTFIIDDDEEEAS